MNVRLHSGLDQAFQVFRLVVPIVTCGGIPLVVVWQSGDGGRLAIAVYLVLFCGGLWAWYRLPVYCTRDGCLGSMRRTAERLSFWRVRATYRCEECATVHVAEILNPNIEVTSGDY